MVEFNDKDMENWVLAMHEIFDYQYSRAEDRCDNLLNFLDKLKVTARFLR